MMTGRPLTFRPATDAELIEGKSLELTRGWKVQFRHFWVEGTDRRTETGVMHRQYGRSTLRVIDGVPFVRHHGRLQRVTASLFDGPETGRPCIVDLRIAGLKSDLERPL